MTAWRSVLVLDGPGRHHIRWSLALRRLKRWFILYKPNNNTTASWDLALFFFLDMDGFDEWNSGCSVEKTRLLVKNKNKRSKVFNNSVGALRENLSVLVSLVMAG